MTRPHIDWSVYPGEKLSKQELQINNTIKKLRAKEKENEALIKNNRYKISKVFLFLPSAVFEMFCITLIPTIDW